METAQVAVFIEQLRTSWSLVRLICVFDVTVVVGQVAAKRPHDVLARRVMLYESVVGLEKVLLFVDFWFSAANVSVDFVDAVESLFFVV